MRPMTLVIPLDPEFLQLVLEWLTQHGEEDGIIYRGEVDEPIDLPLTSAFSRLIDRRLSRQPVRLGKKNLAHDIDSVLAHIARALAPLEVNLVEAKQQVLYVPMGKLFLAF